MSRDYKSIKEVSELYSINPNKLRFYEKKGLIYPKRDLENGYRMYSKDDLVRIQMILTYRMLELPIEKIKSLLDSHNKEAIVEQVLEQLEMLNTVIHRYKNVQSSLSNIIDCYVDSDKVSDVMSKIIDTGEELGKRINHSENWVDKWDFDLWSENYDDVIKENQVGLDFYKNYNEVLERVYDVSKDHLDVNGKVLDIGVGTGALASRYLKDSIAVVGVDQSHKMLLVAKKKYPNMKLRVGNFMKLPFERRTFDRIVSTYAFHHLNETEKELAFKECIRVLKPNGELVIGDMMFANDSSREAFLQSLNDKDRAEVEDEYYTNIESFSNVVKNHGLHIMVEQLDELMHIMRIRKVT